MWVDWVDTDASGRIHNTAPLRWAERAEHSFFRLGAAEHMTSLVRKKVEVTYHRKLSFSDTFTLVFAVASVGRSSVTYRWQAVTDAGIAFDGMTIAVNVDEGGRPSPISDALRSFLDAALRDDLNPA